MELGESDSYHTAAVQSWLDHSQTTDAPTVIGKIVQGDILLRF